MKDNKMTRSCYVREHIFYKHTKCPVERQGLWRIHDIFSDTAEIVLSFKEGPDRSKSAAKLSKLVEFCYYITSTIFSKINIVFSNFPYIVER